ncbi:hypothetical protein AnigIFM60653_001731 [Aspergillus niger]|nr:hypothetical protein AnigIFM60653_001731 [Aspergillus niger]GLA17513.1 hypothetical protein AnigIFM62618_004653 [Aspergillus niger]
MLSVVKDVYQKCLSCPFEGATAEAKSSLPQRAYYGTHSSVTNARRPRPKIKKSDQAGEGKRRGEVFLLHVRPSDLSVEAEISVLMFPSIILRYPFKPLFRHYENKSHREGDMENAQFCRLLQLPRTGILLLSKKKLWQPVERYVQMGFKLRFCIQRENYLQAKHDMLYEQINENPSTGDTSTWVNEMQTYKTELKSLNETICNLERETHRCMSTIPDGPLKRMLCAHEEKENWYLSKFLREECTHSGGCCGRDCGCCEKLRNDKRPLHRSHCTSMCLCCEKAREYPINVDNYEDDPMIVDVFLRGWREFSHSYAGKWVNAYVFGFKTLGSQAS